MNIAVPNNSLSLAGVANAKLEEVLTAGAKPRAGSSPDVEEQKLNALIAKSLQQKAEKEEFERQLREYESDETIEELIKATQQSFLLPAAQAVFGSDDTWNKLCDALEAKFDPETQRKIVYGLMGLARQIKTGTTENLKQAKKLLKNGLKELKRLADDPKKPDTQLPLLTQIVQHYGDDEIACQLSQYAEIKSKKERVAAREHEDRLIALAWIDSDCQDLLRGPVKEVFTGENPWQAFEQARAKLGETADKTYAGLVGLARHIKRTEETAPNTEGLIVIKTQLKEGLEELKRIGEDQKPPTARPYLLAIELGYAESELGYAKSEVARQVQQHAAIRSAQNRQSVLQVEPEKPSLAARAAAKVWASAQSAVRGFKNDWKFNLSLMGASALARTVASGFILSAGASTLPLVAIAAGIGMASAAARYQYNFKKAVKHDALHGTNLSSTFNKKARRNAILLGAGMGVLGFEAGGLMQNYIPDGLAEKITSGVKTAYNSVFGNDSNYIPYEEWLQKNPVPPTNSDLLDVLKNVPSEAPTEPSAPALVAAPNLPVVPSIDAINEPNVEGLLPSLATSFDPETKIIDVNTYVAPENATIMELPAKTTKADGIMAFKEPDTIYTLPETFEPAKLANAQPDTVPDHSTPTPSQPVVEAAAPTLQPPVAIDEKLLTSLPLPPEVPTPNFESSALLVPTTPVEVAPEVSAPALALPAAPVELAAPAPMPVDAPTPPARPSILTTADAFNAAKTDLLSMPETKKLLEASGLGAKSIRLAESGNIGKIYEAVTRAVQNDIGLKADAEKVLGKIVDMGGKSTVDHVTINAAKAARDLGWLAKLGK